MSPSIIRVLDEALINQIAAGEIVESPANVVKELLDNALDAGASQIDVEFKAGGRHSIRVSDDGVGMSASDCALCFARHATSKIQTAADLLELASCGFRGEALAAIAAVSKVHLLSSSGSECRSLRVEGGNLVHSSEGARQRGTTVEVHSLFFNAPVRRDYQESMARDVAAIVAVFTQVALAQPQIGFRLVKNGKEFYHLPPCPQGVEGPFALRVEKLLGRALAEQLIPLNSGAQGQTPHRLWGFLAAPSYDRPNRSGQFLFLNQRPIYSPSIGNAVAQGFGARLSPRRFPCFILHVTLPPQEVDFNVHPQKKEVRFKNSGKVVHWISSAVDRHFLKGFGVIASEANEDSAPLPWEESGAFATFTKSPATSVLEGDALLSPVSARSAISLAEKDSLVDVQPLLRMRDAPTFSRAPQELASPLGDFDATLWQRLCIAIWSPYLLLDLSTVATPERRWWQVGPSRAWLIIDYAKAAAWAHAARVRAARAPARQLLMQPLQLSVSAVIAELISEKLEELEAWGLSLTRTALCDFTCLAVPQSLELSERSLVEGLQQWGKLEERESREKWLAQWLAKQSWYCPPDLSSEVAWRIVQRILRTPTPPRTAGGDALAALFSREDLSKHLKIRG